MLLWSSTNTAVDFQTDANVLYQFIANKMPLKQFYLADRQTDHPTARASNPRDPTCNPRHRAQIRKTQVNKTGNTPEPHARHLGINTESSLWFVNWDSRLFSSAWMSVAVGPSIAFYRKSSGELTKYCGKVGIHNTSSHITVFQNFGFLNFNKFFFFLFSLTLEWKFQKSYTFQSYYFFSAKLLPCDSCGSSHKGYFLAFSNFLI